MLDEAMVDVRICNVIQIVTDNAAAYVIAGRIMMDRHFDFTLFWSTYIAHYLDLLLENLRKLCWVEVVVDGRNITKYIYNHKWVPSLMREHTDVRISCN